MNTLPVITGEPLRLSADLAADRVIGTIEAAAFCNFSVSHFRHLIRTGRAPQPIRLSERKLGFSIRALKAWVADRTTVAA
jgi:prophage regulatory protein